MKSIHQSLGSCIPHRSVSLAYECPLLLESNNQEVEIGMILLTTLPKDPLGESVLLIPEIPDST